MFNRKLLAAVALAAIAGCFTTSQPPQVHVAFPSGGGDVAVSVEGFDAVLTDFIPVTTTTTEFGGGAWRGGRHGRRGGGGGIRTYNSTTYLPNVHETSIYRERAKADLEKCGFICRASAAKYTVRCDWGDLNEAEGLWKRRAQYCASIFLYDSVDVSMAATLRIYDNSSGKLIHSEEFVQDYAAAGWSLIPFFGMQDHEPTQGGYIRHWCRTALADRIAAAAAAFLRPKDQPPSGDGAQCIAR